MVSTADKETLCNSDTILPDVSTETVLFEITISLVLIPAPMMNKMVVANLAHRPTRSVAAMSAIALEVTGR